MKAKRIFSLALCLCMLCSLFTVASISASADEAPTRVLNDFDTIGEQVLLGPNNQGFTGAMSIVDYTEIDADYTDGSALQIYVKDGSVNYGGWTFNFDSSWASEEYDVPVALKFQIWSDTEGITLWSSSGLTANSTNPWTPTDVKTTLKDVGMSDITVSTEPTWVTVDITDIAVPYSARLGMRLNLSGGACKFFMDNVTLVYEEVASRKASFDVEGVEDILVDAAGYVTLPDTTVSGKQFIGWKDENGAVYKSGTTLRLAKSTLFTAVAADIALQTGAGIRWAEKETERGIRFETYVTKEALDTLGSSSFELGALILPYNKYNADITVDTAADYGAINVVDPKVYGETSDGNYRYYCGIVDFEKYFAVSQSALADMKLTAVSYVKVTYADSTVGYFYDHPDATNNVRSVAQVARAALADTEFGYTDAQIAILNLYTQYSQETDVPEYRKDAKDDPNAIEEVEFKFITDITEKVGDGFVNEPMDNGAAINNYTPSGVADLYSHANFSSGKTLVFTLPQSIANGTYKVWFNTRGSNSNRVDNVKIEVTSDAGTFVVAENQTFYSDKSSSWWVVECPNNVQIKGTTTFTFTSQSTSGKIALHDIVLTPVE